MRTRLALLVLVSVAVMGTSVFLSLRMFGQRSRSAGGTRLDRPVAGMGPARVLLNEVSFQPTAGEPQWVELINAGGESATLDGVVLENQAGAKYVLPDRVSLAPNAQLLIRFDGQSSADTSIVHGPSTFLAASGFVQLTRGSEQLDRIAWGDGQANAASRNAGDFDNGPIVGGSLGRVPRTITADPWEWVSIGPQRTTPGKPNPQPSVEVLMPLDGAIILSPPVKLTWYIVSGAVRYRVQVATDRSFASPAIDQTVDNPPLVSAALAPDKYFWRVQAIAADGTSAEYSPPHGLTVRTGKLPAPRPRQHGLLEWLAPALHAQGQPAAVDDELPTVLDVPLIMQHKDTAMLLLETRLDTGAHAWDVDHVEPGPDRADLMNSAPASIAMLSRYYGGQLSQDRINYEVFRADQPGPQGDLGWAPRGYNRERVSRAMSFAFGVPPSVDTPYDAVVAQVLWGLRMNHGTPAIACNEHCVALVGFKDSLGVENDLLVINDPAQGTYLAPLATLMGATVFVMERPNIDNPNYPSGLPMLVRPRSDEPEVSRDSDGDGVVDFDESNRFKTSSSEKDSDQDELPDKEDIKASVHDPRHGFAFGGNGRDFDGDGKMMELDDDSDDGGCLDGWEDVNKNGKFEREQKDLDFFEKKDDPCIKGSFSLKQESAWEQAGPPRDSQTLVGLSQFDLKLRPIDRERWQGRANARFESTSTRVTIGASRRCEEGTSQRQKPYVLPLVGKSRISPDGRIELDVQLERNVTPPPQRLSWRNSCSTPQSGEYEGNAGPAGWPWPHLSLVNGVYDERSERPIPPPVGSTGSGKWTTIIHLEQKSAQRQ